MGESILVEAIGVRIRLELDGLTDAEASIVRAAWRDAECAPSARAGRELPGDDGRCGHDGALSVRVREPGDAADLDALLERLSRRVTLAAIEARRGDVWMLHAAGLALPDGRVIVLVGPSGRGKTTASRALGARLGYVSDETVAIDADGRVFAYRKPLSIIEDGAFPKAQRAPSDVGLLPLPDASLRLAAIVLLDRREDGPEAPEVEALDLGDALEELVSQSSYLAAVPHPLALAAALIAPLGGVRRVTYREASSLREVVDALVAPPTTVAHWRPVAVGAGAADGRQPSAADASTARYERMPVLDAVELDGPDRIAVLHDVERAGPQVQLLGGIAPALWRAASGASRDDLIAAAVAAHGEPEGQDASALVDAAVTELIEAGLLRDASEGPVWRIRDDVAWHDSGDRVVVLSLATPDAPTQVLESSAALIWRALAEPASLNALVSRLRDEGKQDESRVRVDVEAFLHALAARELVATQLIAVDSTSSLVEPPEPNIDNVSLY